LAQAVRHGRRTIAPPVHRPGLESAHRARNSARRNSDQHLPVKIGRPADLREIAVLTALVPSRRSRGRSPIPPVQIVQRSNPMLAHVARLALLMKKSSHPDRPGCRLRQWNRNANLRSAPPPAAPRPAAPRRAVQRFVVLVLTGQALAAAPKAVPPRFVRARTGPVPIVRDQIEPDRTGPGRTVPVLIAPPSIAPAVHGQPVAPVVPALGNSARAGPLAPKATAPVPSPPAPVNPAPAALDPATSARDYPQPENRRGSPIQAERAELLPEAADVPGLHSVPGPAAPPELALAIRARLAVRGNPAAARVPAASARVGSQGAKSEARSTSRQSRMRHPRIAC
jgi:hypothetical protein